MLALLTPLHGSLPLHGIGSRSDLPLPFGFVLLGSLLAVAVSFAVVTWVWRTPRWERLDGGVVLPRFTAVVDQPWVRLAARLAVLALFAWVGLAMWAGADLLTNPTFGFVFAWLWVGIVPLSLLFGEVWRAVNPLRTLYRGLARLLSLPAPAEVPARLGVWPGAFGLAAFAWLELVQPGQDTLAVLRVWAVLWGLVALLGALRFGERWMAAADPFEVYATTVATLSPLIRIDGRFTLVNPLRRASLVAPRTGSVAVLSVLLGSTAFDSFTNTSWWIFTTQDSDLPLPIWGTLGLAGFIAIVALTLSAGCWPFLRARRRSALRADLPSSLDRLAVTASPILVGYAIAHYLSLLVVEGQRTAIGLSDPLGRGWNVFGTAELGVNTAMYDYPSVTAVVQLLAIVGGHTAAVLTAHDVSLRWPPGVPNPHPVRRQLPLLVVMLGYTVAGLLLLFSP